MEKTKKAYTNEQRAEKINELIDKLSDLGIISISDVDEAEPDQGEGEHE